jgi:hypothetical protein
MRRVTVDEGTIGSIVVDHFESIGADVYQEVECPGGVADIVALVAAELWIIEVKTSLSLALVVQALGRRRTAHRVYIAAPYSKNFRDVGILCEEVGIGLLSVNSGWVSDGSHKQWTVIEHVKSKRWNKRPVALRERLCPQHKTHAQAGAASAAGRWTPFRDTCEQLWRVVVQRPGIEIKDAVSLIRHHYASAAGARSSIAHWTSRGKVFGVRLDSSDKRLRLFPSEIG